MSYIKYPATSPYATSPQTSWYMGRFAGRSIPPDSSDTVFTLLSRHQYRPDLLSYDLYGTPEYYWVFCIRNPALRGDPIWRFVAGLKIVVPSAGYLNRIVGS